MRKLAEHGIETGVVMMPILPFIEDSPENIAGIVRGAADHGASFVIPAFGMTVREGQREHFYLKLDEHFPGLRERYQAAFGEAYHCPARRAGELAKHFYHLCSDYGLSTRVSPYPPKAEHEQLSLFSRAPRMARAVLRVAAGE